jgi:hypothetical protein
MPEAVRNWAPGPLKTLIRQDILEPFFKVRGGWQIEAANSVDKLRQAPRICIPVTVSPQHIVGKRVGGEGESCG